MNIPFNRPYMTGRELGYIKKAHLNGHLAGNGEFTRRCEEWLEDKLKSPRALLVPSCTAALEMAALLIGIKPGDEVIMPSFTFVSTANAFALFGGIPVFVDIRDDTLNINENLIELAITAKTKAIVAVHYGGVACNMTMLRRIANKHKIFLIEDAAQAVLAKYCGKPLGGLGDLSAVSFHETKNIISGEGGALLINSLELIERATILRDKGTNRANFLSGLVDKYTWVDLGSSYLPSELTAAFLLAQMEDADSITKRRQDIWSIYKQEFSYLEDRGLVRLPAIPDECEHNAHLFYLILSSKLSRDKFMSKTKKAGISTVFHYTSLHDSPAGIKFGRCLMPMTITNKASNQLVRLPIWLGIEKELPAITKAIKKILENDSGAY